MSSQAFSFIKSKRLRSHAPPSISFSKSIPFRAYTTAGGIKIIKNNVQISKKCTNEADLDVRLYKKVVQLHPKGSKVIIFFMFFQYIFVFGGWFDEKCIMLMPPTVVYEFLSIFVLWYPKPPFRSHELLSIFVLQNHENHWWCANDSKSNQWWKCVKLCDDVRK